MNPYVIQILAMGLTISQLFTKPVAEFRTEFNEKADQAEVQALIQDGCKLVLKTFAADGVDVEPLWQYVLPTDGSNAAAVADDDGNAAVDPNAPKDAPATPAPKGPNGVAGMFAKMDPPTLRVAFDTLCKGKTVENSPVQLDKVIEFYNKAMKDLPDHNQLKNFRFKEASVIKDGEGKTFTELYEDKNRRKFVALKNLPPYVAQAFISAEDKTFREHKGLDLRGILRAFVMGLTSGDKKRPPGGSTITQQVMKNVLLDDALEIERKMREMILAARTETILSKDEIMELYLNYIFLGRASWGIEMAARSYFNKGAVELSVSEAAFLAGINKGPNLYDPSKRPELTEGRRVYVLNRLKEDQPAMTAVVAKALAEPPVIGAFEPPRRRAGFYYVDEIQRQAKAVAGVKSLTDGSFVVRSTMDPTLQKLAEKSLQNGLAAYEARTGRAVFTGPVGSIATEIATYKKEWPELMTHIRSRLYDVQWPIATVLAPLANKQLKVGLQDGSVAWLDYGRADVSKLKMYDLVHVKNAASVKSGKATLMIPPQVQGAIVVMEAKTGRILAMSGGFSYPGSPLNRATQTWRQPGSTLKPFTYLFALNQNMQPNTLIPNVPKLIEIANRPPWAPKNYEGSSSQPVTMRTALENSLNIVAVNTVASVMETADQGLTGVCNVTVEMGVYQKCEHVMPFVLGAQPARLVDMAAAYATIANLGYKPTPYVFDNIAKGTDEVWRRPFAKNQPITVVDRVSFYQVRRMMEGVITRGTAASLKDLTGYVAGKTGTSNSENDAWFVGFTNDVVVATWVGYDNATKKDKRTLGKGNTGAKLAVPIGGEILRYIVARDKDPLVAAPADVAAQIAEVQIEPRWGTIGQGSFAEVIRRQGNGIVNSQFRLVRPEELQLAVAGPTPDGDDTGGPEGQATDQNYPSEYRSEDPRDHYRPGQDDQYQSWRDQNRRVDPVFSNMFGNGN